MEANDFTKFFLFVKGVIETGHVIKYSNRELAKEVKMHFNRILHDGVELEKAVHKALGDEMAGYEDDINSMIIEMVWRIFDLPPDERDAFLDHINKFNKDE